MSTMFWIWLAVIVVTVILEIVTADLISVWFTFGAIIPLILASATNLNMWWQIAIFLVISALLLACLRKITMKYLFKNTDGKTNLDTLIGQKFRLISSTDFETVGKVKVKDIEWSVKGVDDQNIEKGSLVEVVKISGNKLIVKECDIKEKQENKK